jgi:hypothetical protein
MGRTERDLILTRLRSYPVFPFDPSIHPDRRIALNDRRVTCIPVKVERRFGSERRIRTRHLRYLQSRDTASRLNREQEISRYQRLRQNASKEMVSKRTALRLRGLAPGTAAKYLRDISDCERRIKQFDDALERLRREA